MKAYEYGEQFMEKQAFIGAMLGLGIKTIPMAIKLALLYGAGRLAWAGGKGFMEGYSGEAYNKMRDNPDAVQILPQNNPFKNPVVRFVRKAVGKDVDAESKAWDEGTYGKARSYLKDFDPKNVDPGFVEPIRPVAGVAIK